MEVADMDLLPDKEFNKVFNRISETIDLRGAGTPAEISKRLYRKIREIEYDNRANPLAPLQLESKISPLKTLISEGFGRRTIAEAMADPHGKVALTLKYGRHQARRILAKRSRKRLYI
jgi:hypothetical protein